MKYYYFKFLKDLYATFSEEPSFLSSKKVERFEVINTMLIASLIYIFMHIKTMSASDLMTIVIPWAGYGGVSMAMSLKDKNQQTNGNQTGNGQLGNSSVLQ